MGRVSGPIRTQEFLLLLPDSPFIFSPKIELDFGSPGKIFPYAKEFLFSRFSLVMGKKLDHYNSFFYTLVVENMVKMVRMAIH